MARPTPSPAVRRRPLAPVAVIVVLAAGGCHSGSSSGSTSGGASFTLPAPVAAGAPVVEPPAAVVPDDSGIAGVVAYDTSGYPGPSPADANTLPHTHVPGPVTYSVTPPVGGDHNPTWMNCGVYPQPVPSERAVHNLEHGAVWITYRPDLAASDVATLTAFVRGQKTVTLTIQGQSIDTKERYLDLTPFPGLPAPVVASAWGHQLRLDSPSDPRLAAFVDAFRVKPKYTPEYGADCDHQPSGLGGTPQFS